MSLATTITNLETRRDAVAAELAAITTSTPDYSIDGQSVSESAWIAAKLEEINKINELLAKLQPYQIRSSARSG